MPENIPNSDANTTPGVVNPPQDDVNNGKPQSKDSKKDGDEGFTLDPRTFEHPRIKQLEERARAAKEATEKLKAYEEEKLATEKKFEELANKRKEEAETWKSKYTATVRDAAVREALRSAGVNEYVTQAMKLMDISNMQLNEDGTVMNIQGHIQQLLKDNPFLLTKPGTPNLGNPTNPSSNGNPIQFTKTQIADRAFFEANEKAIMEAFRTGNIIDA